jgi:hypothetical protein
MKREKQIHDVEHELYSLDIRSGFFSTAQPNNMFTCSTHLFRKEKFHMLLVLLLFLVGE